MIIPTVIWAIESDDDRSYMAFLYEQHCPLMLKIAWGYARCKADVEDIVSDSCTALIMNIDKIRGMERNVLRAYIVTTVRNTAIDFCRKQQRKNARFLYVDDEVTSQMSVNESTEKKVLLREELRLIKQALDILPEHERDILRLKYQKGLKDNEIAEKVGIAESSIRKYVERARKHLKAAIY